jgi:transposase-like protein
MLRRQYSDSDKAAALAALDANGGNANKTAKELGIGESTLRSWANGRGTHPEVAKLRERKKDEIAGRLVDIVHQIIDDMPSKMKDATLQQMATTLGIAVEKIQLLQGGATERQEVIDNLSDDERANRVAALLDRARARASGQTPNEQV